LNKKIKAMKKNYVSIQNESPRMFKNNILDYFSRASWYVPVVFWIPILIVLSVYSIKLYDVSFIECVFTILASLVFWSFAEYILHRYVFHFMHDSDIGRRMHFMIHGVHHDYPNDAKRLVFPPLAALPISSIFYFLFYLCLGKYHIVFFIGFILGYLVHDLTHYALHHAQWKSPWFLKLKQHHMMHHYTHSYGGYGVTSTVWDKVFGTKVV
jgi:sterol desaturase/sphingolipid hydroxylase (fatty acid hydroxylase superfamily)